MKIAFHGGKCCGIKHIHYFNNTPKDKLAAKDAFEPEGPEWTHEKQIDLDTWGADVSSEHNCYYHAAPKETYLERLDRYLKFLDEWRPEGITEATLTDEDGQNEEWSPVLLERGFKLVNDCLNSNTGNRIFVYHRNKEED